MKLAYIYIYDSLNDKWNWVKCNFTVENNICLQDIITLVNQRIINKKTDEVFFSGKEYLFEKKTPVLYSNENESTKIQHISNKDTNCKEELDFHSFEDFIDLILLLAGCD